MAAWATQPFEALPRSLVETGNVPLQSPSGPDFKASLVIELTLKACK